MTRIHPFIAISLLIIPLFNPPAFAEKWVPIERGVHYREIVRDGLHAYIVRVDLTRDDLRVVATSEEQKGMVVSRFAEMASAIAAVNADYFDEEMRPVGHAMAGGTAWKERHGTRNQPVLGFGENRAEIFSVEERGSELPEWVDEAVSGWPLLIENCTAFTAEQLPGSDFFTRAPHPRTAAGLSEDGRTLYLVVADGRREGVPGPTLAELGSFMRVELEACSALNLDGGGSSAIVIEGELMNQPSDGSERIVANHLAIVQAGCTSATDAIR
ncbi:MAG: phosphodiester glycosidase family protein [Thermoanaerobaculia bacterium]